MRLLLSRALPLVLAASVDSARDIGLTEQEASDRHLSVQERTCADEHSAVVVSGSGSFQFIGHGLDFTAHVCAAEDGRDHRATGKVLNTQHVSENGHGLYHAHCAYVDKEHGFVYLGLEIEDMKGPSVMHLYDEDGERLSIEGSTGEERKLAKSAKSSKATKIVASDYLALLRPGTLVQTLDAVRHGRHAHQEKSKEHPDDTDDPLRHLRRIQEDGGQPTTCETALAEAEQTLAAYEEKEKEEEGPKYLFVQMADQCIFQTTDSGNLVLKSRHFHGDTVKFSDRPFAYEEEISTESFFDSFDDLFNADNGGKPNAAITLVQNDESKDVVVSVFVKAVVKQKDDPDGPTYVYKLKQSDEQDSVTSLSDVMGGKDKMTYDHCSIFIDDAECQFRERGLVGTMVDAAEEVISGNEPKGTLAIFRFEKGIDATTAANISPPSADRFAMAHHVTFDTTCEGFEDVVKTVQFTDDEVSDLTKGKFHIP